MADEKHDSDWKKILSHSSSVIVYEEGQSEEHNLGLAVNPRHNRRFEGRPVWRGGRVRGSEVEQP